MQRRTKKTRGEVLNKSLTAILAATLRAVSLRLTIRDTFNNEPVAKFNPAHEWRVTHSLSLRQRAFQDRTKHIWDPETKRDLQEARKRPGHVGPLSQKETFPAIMAARLSTVHEDCPFAGYGDANHGEQDLVDGPGGLGEAQLEDLLLRVEEGIVDSRKETKKMKKSRERRQAFRDKMKTKWQSARMTYLLNIVTNQKRKGKTGKFLIFSEFLCVLDVAHVALDASGHKVLRFDGWETPSDREKSLRLFEDPLDDHEFLMVTNRSGGEGLNLQTADTVIHLTPCWNPAMTRQCNSRAVRNGRKNDVDVFYFCIMNSMEGYIYRLAQEKDTKASALLDPTKDIVAIIRETTTWTNKHFKTIVSILRGSFFTITDNVRWEMRNLRPQSTDVRWKYVSRELSKPKRLKQPPKRNSPQQQRTHG
jgi:SNF2 family DNA or RNA helicase